MNVRFAAPGGAAGLYEPGSEPALWWGTYTGRGARGAVQRACSTDAPTRTCPKVVEAFGATEFWGLRMSPGLVGTDARHDIALPGNVRRYYMPGTNHGGGARRFSDRAAANERCALPQNPNPMADTTPCADRSADRVGGERDANRRRADIRRWRTANWSPAATVAAAFPKIPGVAVA